jgi:HlyD family secretion protein
MKDENSIELRSEEFQEVLGGVPSWILRWGIMLLAIIVGLLLTGSAVIKYPDVISARIVLTGSNPPADIVARSSGKLKELPVVDNQEVKAGDYLAVIDNPACTQDIKTLQAYLANLNLEQDSLPALPDKDLQTGNLQALYANFYITLFEYLEYKRLLYYSQKTTMTRERIVQYEQQYRSLLRQQKITLEQFSLVQNQYRRDSLLHVNGVISKEELEKSKTQYLQTVLSCENMKSSVNSMQIQIAQLKELLLDNKQQDIEKYNGFYTQLLSLLSQIKTEIESWELSYVLKAPIDGKITFTNYWIINQNVLAGDAVFTIIPKEEVEVIGKATLPTERSGKVKVGQKVNVRLENFPENEFGILRGSVRSISLVPVQAGGAAYYTVEISLTDRLTTTYRKELPYLPNMQGQADIITDDLFLLERLILPVKKILAESL